MIDDGGSGMTTIELSDEVMRRLEELAAERRTDVPGVLAEAIGLQEAFVRARQRGGRLLIDDHGRLSELAPGNAAVTLQGRGTLAAG
jgi:hypothetical protein